MKKDLLFALMWFGVIMCGLAGTIALSAHITKAQSSTPAVYCMEDTHLRMGEIVDKYKETIDGDSFYYVVIAGKIDGKYHTRDIQVNKWMWIHTYRIGDYWSPSI